jgi:hypothetical protein
MLGDTVKHLGFPKHVGRYGKTLAAPKTCCEILTTLGVPSLRLHSCFAVTNIQNFIFFKSVKLQDEK